MIIQKSNIDDYILCPALYACNVIKSRQSTIKIKNIKKSIKKHLIEIASYEMQNDEKLTAHEYRTRFTDKYYRRSLQILKVDSLIKELNTVFDIFAKNVFVGYNLPVEIPLVGTSSEYRYIVDFVLTDEDNNITIVELESLDDIGAYKRRLKNWAHYYAPYTFLAEQFDKKVTLIIIDPDNLTRITAEYSPGRFPDDYKHLCAMLSPIEAGVVYHNLFACEYCEIQKECTKKR